MRNRLRRAPRQRRAQRLDGAPAWIAVALLCIPRTGAALTAHGDSQVTLHQGETISDDVFLSGGRLESDATIQGDLLALGDTVTVRGQVTGDLFVVGREVVIGGQVDGTVRVLAWSLTLDGTASRDVLAAAESFNSAPASRIGRDLLVASYRLTADGSVARNMICLAERFVLNGSVGGDIKSSWFNAYISPSGRVGGDVRYEPHDPRGTVIKGHVAGLVRGTPPLERHPWKEAIGNLVDWLVLCVLVVLLVPGGLARASGLLRGAPVSTTAEGLAGLALLIAAAAGSLLVFPPLTILCLCLLLIVLPLGYLIAATWLGRLVLEDVFAVRSSVVLATMVGATVLTIASHILIVGWLLTLVCCVPGAGALSRWGRRSRRTTVPAPGLRGYLAAIRGGFPEEPAGSG